MSRTLSRWMPPPPSPERSRVDRAIAVTLAVALLSVAGWGVVQVVRHPLIALAIGLPIGVLVWIGGRSAGAAHARWAATRRSTLRLGEDIGTFARAFDRRGGLAPGVEFDPWVVRAVWEGLMPLAAGAAGVVIPLRPEDRLIENLGLDEEDVEELVRPMLARVGRRPGDWRRNPFRTMGVRTVADLVGFLSAQPPDPESERWRAANSSTDEAAAG